jgi:hypothetical protein
VILAVITFLFVALIHSSFSTSVLAVPPASGFNSPNADCTNRPEGLNAICCWNEGGPPGITVRFCQGCRINLETGEFDDCDPVFRQITSGPPVLPKGGVLDEPPTPSLTSPFTPPTGGVLQQPTTTTPTTPPPLFGRNVPLQGGGVFGQQPAAIVPPTPVPTPVLTPEPPVPMFGSTQQQAPPTPPPTGDEGLTGVAPRTVEPLTRTCPVGNVWDPNLMICVPDLPPLPTPQLCPDGSIPQSTGPGGIRPECPPFEAEQPEVEEQAEEPQDEGQEEPDEGQDTVTGPLT